MAKQDKNLINSESNDILAEALKEIEKSITDPNFVKCSSSYLVNLDFVDAIDKDEARIDGRKIKIARTRKKDFVNAFLNKYK